MFTYNIAVAQLKLVTNSSSDYHIIIAEHAGSLEKKAATVLQKYLADISSVRIPIITDTHIVQSKEICIGNTNRIRVKEQFKTDGFMIKSVNEKLFIYGEKERSVLFGVYHLLEKYLGCRKFTSTLKYIPKQESIHLLTIRDLQNPSLRFRQVYYPDQYDEEYRDWHKLHLLEDEWGLWGHSFDKLVPPSIYFKDHPEYYALVNGERKPTQLCLSNPHVYRILVDSLSELMNEEPEKKIWSVSQNDGFGYCTCKNCSATDIHYGGPQGSLIKFVNKIAKRFPDRTISTLAYLYSKHPPVGIKPGSNVSIMLSSIDLNRAKSIIADDRAAPFRNDVRGWSGLTNQLMIWDYVVQFTNYLSPFPNLSTLQENMRYFGSAKINGAFIQGTEGTPGEFSYLKAYLLAKLSWNPDADTEKDIKEFVTAYYGKAAPYILQYIKQLEIELQKSNRVLDIYGEPTNEWNTWLRPELIEKYGDILQQAAASVEANDDVLQRVLLETLPLEFAVLQQSRFYGIEKHGLFERNGNDWNIRKGIEKKISNFIEVAKKTGIKQMKEDGFTPDDYLNEWNAILKKGPCIHSAINKDVLIITPFSAEYPAKGSRTLTDGGYGYNNFQYNYLGWHGDDMEIVIDLGEFKPVNSISAGFLEDQRHWAFLPASLSVELSEDNLTFVEAGTIATTSPEENYLKETHRLSIQLPGNKKARYIRIIARNQQKLPEWRDFPNRKSWIFCDEIAVF